MGIFDDVIWFLVSLYAHQIGQIQADMDDKDEFSLVFLGVVFLALIRFAQFRKMTVWDDQCFFLGDWICKKVVLPRLIHDWLTCLDHAF